MWLLQPYPKKCQGLDDQKGRRTELWPQSLSHRRACTFLSDYDVLRMLRLNQACRMKTKQSWNRDSADLSSVCATIL